MVLINQVVSNPLQKQTLVLPDGTSFSMTMYFIPMQYGWFITELTYKDFVLRGLRITNSPNMLHQFRNHIPFGLACFSTNNREPSQQTDFLSKASNLYVLTAAEVLQYTRFLENG